MNIEKLAIEAGVIHVSEDDNSTYWTENNAIEVLERFAQLVLRTKMTDIQKLQKAQSLMSEVYGKYGDLLKDDYPICSHLSVADGCVIDAIDYLAKLGKEIGNA